MNNKNATGDFDPGAMRFGNFINYYQFHPPVERIKLLPEHIWRLLKLDDSVVCLDVGCNCGDLTESLHKILQTRLQATPRAPGSTQAANTQQVRLLGVDIDSNLIDRANEKNTYKGIEYECLDIMQTHAMEYLNNYLMRNWTHDRIEHFQRLSNLLRSSTISEQSKCQANPSQRSSSSPQLSTIPEPSRANSFQNPPNLTHLPVRKFDIVFCFSVTMWIHLNHGDAGLFDFLRKIVHLGKYLVMENQPWKCYRNAQRRIVRSSTKDKRNDIPVKDVQEKAVGNLAEMKGTVTKCDGLVINKVGDDIGNSEKDSTLSSGTELKGNKKCLRNLDKSSNGSENVREENLDVVRDVTKHSEIKSNNKECKKQGKIEGNSVRLKKREKMVTEEVGFKHYRELKLRSNVDKYIDDYLREKCSARKLYQSEENEWGRVITVYETLC